MSLHVHHGRPGPLEEFRATSKIKPPNIAQAVKSNTPFVLDFKPLRGKRATDTEKRAVEKQLGKTTLNWRAVNKPSAMRAHLTRLYKAKAQENRTRVHAGKPALNMGDLPVYVHENGHASRLRDRLIRKETFQRDLNDIVHQILARNAGRADKIREVKRTRPTQSADANLQYAWHVSPNPTYIISVDFSHNENWPMSMREAEWQSPAVRVDGRDVVLTLDTHSQPWLNEILRDLKGKCLIVAQLDELTFGKGRKLADPDETLCIPVLVRSQEQIMPRQDNTYTRVRVNQPGLNPTSSLFRYVPAKG